MSRITNKNVKIGESYVLPLTNSSVSKYELKVESILSDVEIERQRLLKQAENDAENIKNRANLLVQEAENKAQEIINNAQSEATKIIQDAQNEQNNIQQQTQEISKSAYNEGFEQGQKDGLEKFNQDSITAIKSLDALVASTAEIKNNIVKSADIDIVDLVVAIANKITTRSFDKDMLKEITLSAINQLKEKENVSIIVNPKLISNISELVPEFKNEISQMQNINIIEEASLSSDGVIVQSTLSRVDARISSQIDEIATRLINGIKDDSEQE